MGSYKIGREMRIVFQIGIRSTGQVSLWDTVGVVTCYPPVNWRATFNRPYGDELSNTPEASGAAALDRV
jgi:hypothetical protein